MEMITVLKICPGCKPEKITIPHELSEFQHLVGGYIEAVYPFMDPVAVVCNSEGKLTGEKPNRALREPDTGEILDVICGTFFICGLTEDDFGSLTDEQIAKYSKLFETPEVFLWDGSRLVVLKIT